MTDKIDIGPFQNIVAVSWNLLTVQFTASSNGFPNVTAKCSVNNRAIELDVPDAPASSISTARLPKSFFVSNTDTVSIRWTGDTSEFSFFGQDFLNIFAVMRLGNIELAEADSPDYVNADGRLESPVLVHDCNIDFTAKTINWTTP